MAEAKKKNSADEKSRSNGFFAGVKAEFKKIVWTDRPTLAKQTLVVTVITIILGALISIMDAGILKCLNFLIR